MTFSSGPQYILTFGTNLGRTRIVRIHHANGSLTPTTVAAAMGEIVDSSMLWTQASGHLTSARSAVYQEKHITPINIFA
jgi:hypothetical protein